MKRHLRRSIAAAAGVLVAAVYVLRLNPVAGLMVDDAAYVVLGKAIAEGHGYRLISSPVAILPSPPPGFPLLLSFVFHIAPEFPANVWLLKSISVAAMLAVGLLTFVYLHRDRRIGAEAAALAATAAVLTPALVFLATSTVMSECVFTLIQLAAVVMIHRSGDAGEQLRFRRVGLAAALVAAAMLVRSAAVALVVAALAWWLMERRWRSAALFTAVLVLCLLPWILYARAHRPSDADRAAHGGAIAYTYIDQLSMRWSSAPHYGRITIGELPARVAVNIVDIAARGVGGVLAPILLRGPEESGEELDSLGPSVELSPASMGSAGATMFISSVLFLVALVGFVRTALERLTVAELLMPLAMAVVVIWPYRTFRFVLPLTPFLLLYFVRGMQAVAPHALRATLLCIIGLHLFDHGSYLALARHPDGVRKVHWLSWYREVESALDWVSTSPLGRDGHAIASSNPPLMYLRTGRTSIPSDYMTFDWNDWRRRGIRYVVLLFDVDLPAHTRHGYDVLYRSSGGLWVVKI